MNPLLSYNEIIALIDDFDPVVYSKTRNHLRGQVSRLSPYITRGVISLATVRDRVLQKYSPNEAEKFLQELAWREYFQKVYYAKRKDIFSDLRFSRQDWKSQDLVMAVADGQTGIEAIDIELKNLFETGYMHNHARMWTAMLSCNVAKAHWYNMSRFMYYHLLDGDLASNTLSWQWVSGTSVQKQYVADQKLINSCSDIKQSGTYLDVAKEGIGFGVIPKVLSLYTEFKYQTIYPVSSKFESLQGKNVFIYHPWSIDPEWRVGEVGERIFVLEPRLFDKFPVSEKVMSHILDLLKIHVSQARLYVGNIETLPDIDQAKVFSKMNPATTHFPGTKDKDLELFPQVQGYYSSFFKFWQECMKYTKLE